MLDTSLYIYAQVKIYDSYIDGNIYQVIPIPTYREEVKLIPKTQYEYFFQNGRDQIGKLSILQINHCMINPNSCELLSPLKHATLINDCIFNIIRPCEYNRASDLDDFLAIIGGVLAYSVRHPVILNITCYEGNQVYIMSKSIQNVGKFEFCQCNFEYQNNLYFTGRIVNSIRVNKSNILLGNHLSETLDDFITPIQYNTTVFAEEVPLLKTHFTDIWILLPAFIFLLVFVPVVCLLMYCKHLLCPLI